jgi:hypothetical protein
MARTFCTRRSAGLCCGCALASSRSEDRCYRAGLVNPARYGRSMGLARARCRCRRRVDACHPRAWSPRSCRLRDCAGFGSGERHIAGFAAGRGGRGNLWPGARLLACGGQHRGRCPTYILPQPIAVPSYRRAAGKRRAPIAQPRRPDCAGRLETGVPAASLPDYAVFCHEHHTRSVRGRPTRLRHRYACIVAGVVWVRIYRTLADSSLSAWVRARFIGHSSASTAFLH